MTTASRPARPTHALLPLLFLCVAGAGPALRGQAAAERPGRVVVLGVDGMDHALSRELMEEGRLPHLEALAEQGAFHRLTPTNPAQSPVSWAVMLTGREPHETGIFGFLSREVEDGRVVPRLALARKVKKELLGSGARWMVGLGLFLLALVPVLLRRTRGALRLSIAFGVLFGLGLGLLFQQVPSEITQARSRLEAEPYWRTLDEEGVPTTSLFVPMGFPAPRLTQGRLLAGLGVPDLLGTMGTVTVHTAEPIPAGGSLTQMGGRRRPLELVRQGGERLVWRGELEGPANPLRAGAPVRVPFEVHLAPRGSGDTAGEVRLQGRSHALPTRKGSFTDPISLTFDMGLFFALQGTVRFSLQAGEQGLDPRLPVLYQEPLQIDPARAPALLPIASSTRYAADLAEAGRFETLGWAVATNPYQDRLIDPETLVADAWSVMDARAAVIRRELQRGEWRLFFGVLSTPDRVQHVLWRTRDPEHPAHDPAEARRFGDVIPQSYERVDRMVGFIREQVLRDGDVLLVVSDHGFAPFRRAVNLNRWLAEKGWLVGRPDGGRRLEGGLGEPVFSHLDWSRTRAYHLGLGRIWLNLRGREPKGIVDPADREALLAELKRGLLALEDGGVRVVDPDALHEPEAHARASDLVVGFHPGWRVSWASCLGGLDEPVFSDNTGRWSGDHCSTAPGRVPGVLYASVPLPGAAERQPHVRDIWPTLRALLGLPPLEAVRGTALR